ncbi:hypothetical protein [Polystyrenella longa]|nr:hypothetical protein [Polystyrenella longa]
MKNRLMDNSGKLCFCMMTCGVLGILSGTSLQAQTNSRMPVIQSLPSRSDAVQTADRRQAGRVILTPVIESSELANPGKVYYERTDQGTFTPPSSREEPGRVAYQPAKVEPKALPATQQSEYKKLQQGTFHIDSLSDDWNARGDLPSAPPAQMERKSNTRLSASPVLQHIEAQEYASQSPVALPEPEYIDVPEFEERAIYNSSNNNSSGTSFETSPITNGSGKPGAYSAEEADWIANAFAPDARIDAIESVGFVNIDLDQPAADSEAKQVSFQQSAAYNTAMAPAVRQSSTSSLDSFEETFENLPRRKGRMSVNPASYLEEIAEEGAENIPEMQTVGAWFGSDGGTVYADATCPPQPQWSFRAEALYWHRSDPNGGEPLLIRVPSQSAPQSYIGNDVDFDNELGQRYRLERMGTEGTGFDMEFFGVNDWSDTARWQEERMIVLGTEIGAGTGAVTSDSEFYSWELNGRREWDPWTTMFAGFRVLVLDEFTSVSGAGDVTNVFSSVDIENNMYGLQAGLDRTLFDNGGVLMIDMSFNLGVFYNSIESNTVNFPSFFDNDRSSTSLLRELNFNMTLAVTNHVSVIGGYTLLWLDDVALGPDQFLDRNNSLNDDSNIFVHGGNLGLLFTW